MVFPQILSVPAFRSTGFSAWDCAPPSPSPDAAAGLSTCTRAAALREHDGPRLRRCPPSQSLREDADRNVRPWPESGAVPVCPAHPAIACGSVRLRCEILTCRCAGLQGAVETVQHGQKRLHCVGNSKLAKFLLLPGGALARVLELGLQARQAVEQRVPLRLQLVAIRWRRRPWPAAPPVALIRRGQFVLRIQSAGSTSDFPFPLAISKLTQIRSVSCQTAAQYRKPPSWCAGSRCASARSPPAIPSLHRPRAPERR